ncbi:MAG: glycosyl transferase [Betaproteobacteria bacterium]|nr:glycosyl transferase [Betaproteobacteria bacterium]
MSDIELGAAAYSKAARTSTTDVLSGYFVLPALALFCLLWTLYLARVTLNPPVDNIEQLTWVRSLEWGYFKHPPFPTWLLWPAVALGGLDPATSYAIGALTKGIGLAGFWWLMLRLRGPLYAAVALMAACCIVYYSRHLHLYNHNVVMFAAVVGTVICTWQAWRLKSLRWWALLGVSLGIGLLTKYQAVVTATGVAVFFWLSGSWRERIHRHGAVLAMIVALVMFAPHLWWLAQHPINPLTYAVDSSLGAGLGSSERVLAVLNWVVDHLFNRGLGALLLLLGIAFLTRRIPPAALCTDRQPLVARDASALLIVVFAVTPIVFIALTVLLLGAESRKHWGTAYLIWMVPALMESLRRVNWNRAPLGWALTGFLLIQAVLVLDHRLTTLPREADVAQARVGQPMAASWAEEVARQARFELNAPINIVTGPETIAAAFALALPEKPRVLINGSPAISPWIPADAVHLCSRVDIGWGEPPPGAYALKGGPQGLYWRSYLPAHEEKCPFGPNHFGRPLGARLASASGPQDRR